MFPLWRVQLREARAAWHNGRYDEAGRLLSAEPLREFCPAKELARDVACKIVERAEERFARGDSLAGWQDLAMADKLGGQGEAIRRVQREYAEHVLTEVIRYLSAGEPTTALRRLAKLERRALVDETARRCKQIAILMQEAEASAARAHFGEAAGAIAKAQGLAAEEFASNAPRRESEAPDSLHVSTIEVARRLEAQRERLVAAGQECQRLSGEMHTALASEDWSRALGAAESLLAIAPRHSAARQARQRAWQAVGMNVTQLYLGRRANQSVSLQIDRGPGRDGRRSTRPSVRSSESETVAGTERPLRALLWVDAVGGYLVCLDDTVVLGQPSAGESVAVPILADLSRRHAVIRRDGGQYLIEPIQEVKIDGRPITSPFVLSDNQLIQLGESVRIRFSKPHALSATAKLAIESHHKSQPSADFVLLMADSCVLGPNKHCHVRCRTWEHDVIVYRQGDRIFCRSDEPLSLDGVVSDGATEVRSGARVEGEAFAFTWEALT